MAHKKINELSSDTIAIVVFQDEARFNIKAAITRQWYLKVRPNPREKSMAYSGFIASETGEPFMTKPDWLNYEITINNIRKFIASFCSNIDKRVYLIMDNAPWYQKTEHIIESEDGHADIYTAVTIISLPPYCLDLNPIEQVWRVTR